MTQTLITLDNALHRIATIHQQHSIKCYVSLQYLQSHFNWPDKDWQQITAIIDMEEPIYLEKVLGQKTNIDVVVRRRHWVLQHGLYPYTYFIMQQWINEDGFQTIFHYYLNECLSTEHYLNHHLSILLSFNEAHSQLENKQQTYRFIERFCEFVTSTFYGNNQIQYPVSPSFNPKLNQEGFPELDTVVKACLTYPGFWGHNIITLSWIMKNQTLLNKAQWDQCLLNLYQQCYWVFNEDGDAPKITTHTTEPLELNPIGWTNKMCPLENACYSLLLKNKNNLHQITLAAAIVYLAKNLTLKPLDEQRLLSIAHHFA
ncbi:hypothetical protein [uncultured Shewanella sp.]|uniref:hypothetical protein n=1 Tax=uncultured Shewanella sp. TaxID=173975 RepID=UPI0026379ED3|nr:hypothetical protein [uncultured Shewanella sp.]